MRTTITAAERADVATIGRYVRRLEIAAREEQRKSDAFARAGRPAMAALFLISAEGAKTKAAHLKDQWGRCEGFNDGYAA